MDVAELLDRHQIADLLTRYTRAVDTKNFTDLYEVFTADAVLDYSSPGGPVGGLDEVIPWVEQGLAGFARTQHLLGQIAIELDGDTATATAYMYNPMVAIRPDGSEQLLEVGGYYHHTLVRTADGWRSTRIVDDVQWYRGF